MKNTKIMKKMVTSCPSCSSWLLKNVKRLLNDYLTTERTAPCPRVWNRCVLCFQPQNRCFQKTGPCWTIVQYPPAVFTSGLGFCGVDRMYCQYSALHSFIFSVNLLICLKKQVAIVISRHFSERRHQDRKHNRCISYELPSSGIFLAMTLSLFRLIGKHILLYRNIF